MKFKLETNMLFIFISMLHSGFLPSTEEWGANRKNYYSTSYVDDDWGGMNENEIEVAELEEQDAIMRQKKMDTALQLCSYFQVNLSLSENQITKSA